MAHPGRVPLPLPAAEGRACAVDLRRRRPHRVLRLRGVADRRADPEDRAHEDDRRRLPDLLHVRPGRLRFRDDDLPLDPGRDPALAPGLERARAARRDGGLTR